jgi:type I restriction enzyme S subunit
MSTPYVAIADVCDVVSGATPKTNEPTFWDGDIPWVTPKDLSEQQAKEISATARCITSAGLDSCSTRILPAGSVLLSSRAPIGLVAINTVPMCTNQGFKSLVPKAGVIDSGYLYWWLSANKATLQHLGRGATFKEVSKQIVADLQIPLPTLCEQKRIAAILDAAAALQAKRQASIEQLDYLLQSTFLQTFGDPVTNPRGWIDSVLLGEVADITSGVTKGRKLRNQSTREVPYLAVVNVQDRHLVLDPVKMIEATDAEIAKYRLLRSDLLLTEGGDRDKLGRGTLWQDELPECIHQNHIFRVRLHDERWVPVFLNWLVGSDRGKRYFLSQAKQTTGIASINLSQLKRFPLLLPPLPLQQRFASVVEAVESHKILLKAQQAELHSLFASLQLRAFSGELCSSPV